ncbi:MAG TPA: hypothetical protein VG737_16585 [Cyclobacteriaceae bacterium]|nr:hypothetical protein [Cyclobacteriaceae bacterium]
MYTISDKSQFQARAIKQGEHSLATAHQEIVDWISKEFNVRTLDFSCEKRSTTKSHQQLVHIILDTAADVKKLQADHSARPIIGERFLNYFMSENAHATMDSLKRDVYPQATTPYPEVIVTYRPLKDLDSKIIEEMLDDERREILKNFENVWTISMYVIFYYTDAQIKENEANGTSAKITEAIGQLDEKYGMRRPAPYRFDSKESFDRDYESKWHYYWK